MTPEAGSAAPSAGISSAALPTSVVFAIGILATLPLWTTPALPLTDLGGHIGRFTVQLDAGRTPQLAQWYSFHWHLVPNLGVDLFVQGLAPIMGLERTVRLAVALAALLTAAGILLLSREVHGKVTAGAIMALPLIYGFSFHFGFLNFNLSLGLALCAGWLWIRLERMPTVARWLGFAIIASLVWVCHLVGWAIFCIIAGSRELTRQWSERGALRGIVATSIVMTCVLVPLAIGWLFGPDGGEHGETVNFFAWPMKLLGLLWVLRDRWQAFDLASMAMMIAFVIAMCLHRKSVLDRGMSLAAVILLASVLVIPYKALGSEFADIRLIAPTLMFALLAARPGPDFPKELASTLFAFAIAFCGARLAYNTWSLWDRGRVEAQYLQVLDEVPRGSQLVTFGARPCNSQGRWELDWRTHLAGYALARRGAFANDQWEIPGAQLIRVHNRAAEPFMTDPSQMQSVEGCGRFDGIRHVSGRVPEAVNWMWVIWDEEPQALPGWSIKKRSGWSVLYRRS